MLLSRANGKVRKARWWNNFGIDEPITLNAKKVLEVGSGKGQRCFEAASRGASRVVGVDTQDQAVRTARETQRSEYPHLQDVVRFELTSLQGLPEQDFDVVLSENAFEHISDVPGVLEEIRRHLKPGGRAYIGFGPLFHSPDGDHGWIKAALPPSLQFPWCHVVLPRSYLLDRIREHYGIEACNFADVPFDGGLNELTIWDFERLFRSSPLELVSLRSNVGYSPAAKAFAMLGKVPALRTYFTFNCYAVLENRAS